MGCRQRAVVGDQLEIFALMALIRGGTPAALAVWMAIEARFACLVSVETFSTVFDARIGMLQYFAFVAVVLKNIPSSVLNSAPDIYPSVIESPINLFRKNIVYVNKDNLTFTDNDK